MSSQRPWQDRLAQRVGAVQSGQEGSIFLHMLAISREVPDLISLGRGDPDLPTPPHVIEAAQQALAEGKTKYTPPAGLDQLRTAIAHKLQQDNNLTYDPMREIVVTTGAQEAISVIFQTLLDDGDEVLLPDPYYMAHRQAINAAGGNPVTLRTQLEDNFVVQPDAVEAAITPKTKAIILTSPSNPTGAVIDRQTAATISQIAIKHDLVVISDELYEKLVFDGASVTSIAGLPDMWERTITVNGVSKVYNMTGMRVGYIAAPAEFVEAALELHHLSTICAPTVSQWAALAALTGPQASVQDTLATYIQRRQVILDYLAEYGISSNRPQGAFFVFADIRPTGFSSLEFCEALLQDVQVQIFPGTQYGEGGEGFVRMSFLAPVAELEVALKRFGQFYQTHTR
jgi:aminotransferase